MLKLAKYTPEGVFTDYDCDHEHTEVERVAPDGSDIIDGPVDTEVCVQCGAQILRDESGEIREVFECSLRDPSHPLNDKYVINERFPFEIEEYDDDDVIRQGY